MNQLKFDDIIDRYKGKPCICIAHGPSLDKQLQKIRKFLHYCIIGTNDWYLFHKDITPNFSVMANSIFTIERHYNNFNKHPYTTLVYADSVDLTPHAFCRDNLACNFLPYDQRHFKGERCSKLIAGNMSNYGGFDPTEKCCNHIVPNRLTIQEEVQKKTGFERHYKTGDTVALHMIALAILLGCCPIYFIGIDLDYSKGFANNSGGKDRHTVNNSEITDYRERILEDLDILNNSAQRIGSEIINLNKDSTFQTVRIGNL